MQKLLARAFGLWVPVLVLTSGLFLFAYLAVQQNYRQSMNDPQMQLAEDAAAYLSRDYTPAALVPRGVAPIDLAESLAPWLSVYDASGTPLESSGVLDGAQPQLPLGIFDTATWRAHKTFAVPNGLETRVTWEPRSGVRQAVVLVQFTGPHGPGYVAVGRSMRAVEERISGLMQLAAVAWGTTALATLVAICILLALGWL